MKGRVTQDRDLEIHCQRGGLQVRRFRATDAKRKQLANQAAPSGPRKSATRRQLMHADRPG